jgi:uncharacterized protein (DUF362 family)
MAKGVSIKFKSYSETIPKVLELVKLGDELKKYNSIVLKPTLKGTPEESTSIALVEQLVRYCLTNKNPAAEVLIAEGADGADTEDLFKRLGYNTLAEKYSIGLVDLNTADVEEVVDSEFLKFEKIYYPKVLRDSFIISIPAISAGDEELIFPCSLSNMLGAFPSEYYSGFLSSKKKKIRKHAIKYSVHDILKCKMPQLAIIDLLEKGVVLAGVPLEMDKQAAKLYGLNWRDIQYLRLVDESFSSGEEQKQN